MLTEIAGHRIALPGRSIDELIGQVEEKRSKPHAPGRCVGLRCNDPVHKPDRRVYLTDGRPESPYRAHHDAAGTWICFYCHPHADLLEAWAQTVGTSGGFELASVEAIHRPDGVLLVGRSRDHICSQWLAFEERPR